MLFALIVLLNCPLWKKGALLTDHMFTELLKTQIEVMSSMLGFLAESQVPGNWVGVRSQSVPLQSYTVT
jgi:hypothetical protein